MFSRFVQFPLLDIRLDEAKVNPTFPSSISSNISSNILSNISSSISLSGSADPPQAPLSPHHRPVHRTAAPLRQGGYFEMKWTEKLEILTLNSLFLFPQNLHPEFRPAAAPQEPRQAHSLLGGAHGDRPRAARQQAGCVVC